MKKNQIFITLFITLGILSSCTKNDEVKDTTAPTVTTLTLNGKDALAGEVAVSKDSVLNLAATFSDDMELSEASIEIHEAFDDHDHENARLTVEGDTLKFGPKIYPLTGTTHAITEAIEALNNEKLINGDYHLEIILLDKAANRTIKAITFEVEDLVTQ